MADFAFSTLLKDTPGAGQARVRIPAAGDRGVLPGPLQIAAGTHTTAVPAVDLAQTWNNAAVAFTGFKFNVTDTASAAGSLLADFQLGGVSNMKLAKGGNLTVLNNIVSLNAMGCSNAFAAGSITTGGPLQFGFGGDLVLYRDAANTLAQRNGTNAQAFNLYGTYTDGSNYRRVAKGMSTAGVAYLRPEGAGTGATGNVLHISGLPTSNPGPGILWNNAGTPAIGT